MAKRINVKLILELSAGGLTQNEIAVSRHFSKTSVSLVLKTAKELNVTVVDGKVNLPPRGCGRNPGPNEVINRRRSRTCIPTKKD